MDSGVIDHDTAEAWARAKRMATCEAVPGAPPSWTPIRASRLLDGRTHDEFPAVR